MLLAAYEPLAGRRATEMRPVAIYDGKAALAEYVATQQVAHLPTGAPMPCACLAGCLAPLDGSASDDPCYALDVSASPRDLPGVQFLASCPAGRPVNAKAAT